MVSIIIDRLNEYYQDNGIHPLNFRCPNQDHCREHAYQQDMIEAKMSLVGSLYGVRFPRIVVVSLDPPSQDKFKAAEQRILSNIAEFTEAENYSIDRPNPHWSMTQIIVKDILLTFGFQPSNLNAAIVSESYNGRPIENVTAYFAHVNVAKCSMNYPDKRQAARFVHNACSHAYLLNELAILKPEILVTQGRTTNEIMGKMLIDKSIFEEDLPCAFEIKASRKSTLWLPMHHPTRQQKIIRKEWPYYEKEVRKWGRKWEKVEIPS